MLKKVLLNLADKNLGASGGTDYGPSFELKGEFNDLYFGLHAKKEAGTTPTLDVSIETSFDGTNWIASGIAFTQVTTSTNANEGKAVGSNILGPYVRAKYVIGGTDTPTYDIWVLLFALGGSGRWGDE